MAESLARVPPQSNHLPRLRDLLHRVELFLPVSPIKYDAPFDLTPNLTVLRENEDDEARRRKVNFLWDTKGTLEIGLKAAEGIEGVGEITLGMTVDRDPRGDAVSILRDTHIIVGFSAPTIPDWELYSGKLTPDDKHEHWEASGFRHVATYDLPELHRAIHIPGEGDPVRLLAGDSTRVRGLLFSKKWDQLHL